MEVHPRTEAIISLDYVPIYVSFATTSFPPAAIPARRPSGGVTLPPHSTPLHLTRSLPLTPPLCPGPRSSPSTTSTPRLSLPLPPSFSPSPSQCGHAPTTARYPRSGPPSVPLIEIQIFSRHNIMCGRVLPPCERLPDPLKTHFPHCLRQRRLLPAPITPSLRLLPGDPPRDPMLEAI